MDGWNVTEDPSFEPSVIGCGGYAIVDEVLTAIDYALHRNPLGFPSVPGMPNIRLAKTSLRIRDGFIIPALTLRFWTDAHSRTVFKLYVEISKPEEMKHWDDDEIPF
ncbi:hypothetical protein [Mesorhizobium sanjuanii]|uniref:hypothetical protein n=1 Tax=Mesorhizobium sanjuanii TaxID=2037900 RepID=UPI00105566B3|nr:hypothetical protein [Mesorhizobium sanjuanii]